MTSVQYRPLEAQDLLSVQECNTKCLPENYQYKYYLYHYISWPRASWVAIADGKLAGYVLAKLDEESGKIPWGHVTSLAVNFSHRGKGIAENLMRYAEASLFEYYKVSHITLHVRVSNKAAFKLYNDKLGFQIGSIDEKYYADGEDAYSMKKTPNKS